MEINKSYLSDWIKLNFSVAPKQIPTYKGRNEKVDVTDHIVMAKKKKTCGCSNQKVTEKNQ